MHFYLLLLPAGCVSVFASQQGLPIHSVTREKPLHAWQAGGSQTEGIYAQRYTLGPLIPSFACGGDVTLNETVYLLFVLWHLLYCESKGAKMRQLWESNY